VSEDKEALPIATLLAPTVSASPVKAPIRVFLVPVVIDKPASYPIATLSESVADVKF